MGNVVALDQARRNRAARLREAARYAPMHPALRWAAGDDGTTHRRTSSGSAVCGAGGVLRLADSATGLCPDCYPARGTGT